MESRPRIGLPLLAAGQMQKELWHNEALLLVEHLLCGEIDADIRETPPPDPVHGRWYRVGDAADGAWTGHSGKLALASAMGWRFIAPFEGLALAEADSACVWRYSGGEWFCGIVDVREVRVGGVKVLGSQQPSIPGPMGGSTIDAEVRASVVSVLAALRAHGLIA